MTRKNRNKNRSKGSTISGEARGSLSKAKETKGNGIALHSDTQVKTQDTKQASEDCPLVQPTQDSAHTKARETQIDGIALHSDSQVKQQDTKQASEKCPLVQPTQDSGKGNKDCDYLTIEELATLDQYTHVVVDMSAVLKKKCDIYTQAFVVYEGIDSHRSAIAAQKQTVGSEVYREAVAHCTSADPDALFHAMSIGGKEELKQWKLFSSQCLLIATHRYLVHNKPFPVRHEFNPSLPLTICNRARITQFWSSYIFGKGDNDEPSGFKGGAVVGAGCEHMNFWPSEIGSEDPLLIDVSDYVSGFKLTVQKPRDGVLDMIEDILKSCGLGLVQFHKDMYNQLREQVAGFTEDYVRSQSRTTADSCTCLTVYDRLLHGKPLRLVDNARRRYMTDVDNPNEGHDYDPVISSGKGGYEVHGEFIKGAGEMTAHVPFEDVDPGMTVWLDMSEELGEHPIIRTTHKQIMHLHKLSAEMVTQNEPEVVKRLVAECRMMCLEVDPSTYQHAQAGSKEAAEKWEEHLHLCVSLVTDQSAAYKKPIRLRCDEASW